MVKKAIIVTPTSLVSNWEAEIKKWVEQRVQLMMMSLELTASQDPVACCRSEIHEKMNCHCCENYDTGSENIEGQEECESENGSSVSDQEVFDIGGFAGIAGCLDKLKSYRKTGGDSLRRGFRLLGGIIFTLNQYLLLFSKLLLVVRLDLFSLIK